MDQRVQLSTTLFVQRLCARVCSASAGGTTRGARVVRVCEAQASAFLHAAHSIFAIDLVSKRPLPILFWRTLLDKKLSGFYYCLASALHHWRVRCLNYVEFSLGLGTCLYREQNRRISRGLLVPGCGESCLLDCQHRSVTMSSSSTDQFNVVLAVDQSEYSEFTFKCEYGLLFCVYFSFVYI